MFDYDQTAGGLAGANDTQPLASRNLRNGKFKDVPWEAGLAFTRVKPALRLASDTGDFRWLRQPRCILLPNSTMKRVVYIAQPHRSFSPTCPFLPARGGIEKYPGFGCMFLDSDLMDL